MLQDTGKTRPYAGNGLSLSALLLTLSIKGRGQKFRRWIRGIDIPGSRISSGRHLEFLCFSRDRCGSEGAKKQGVITHIDPARALSLDTTSDIKPYVTSVRKVRAQSPERPHGSAKQPKQKETGKISSRSRSIWFLLPILLLATLSAYYPAWHGRILWDDDAHITPIGLRSADGLWRIWFDLGATQQYYPVVHSAFWLLHWLFGDNTLGYHLLNIVFHAVSAFLIAVILRRLAVPGAWLAAVIFALHPVHVESVAWISEMKNTLSGVFYLSAALAYLQFDKDRHNRFYALAIVLFVLALLSKSVTATLPAALLVVLWWRRGWLSGRHDVLPLMPFFALGVGGGGLTACVERTLVGAQGSEFQFTLIERGLIAGRVIWFYVSKLLWPANLVFIYPRWQVSQGVWWQYLYPFAAVALLAGFWLLRKRTRGPLTAILFFSGTLFPAMGFVNVWPFAFSFVADHFQYLASIGIISLFSAVLASFAKRSNLQRRPAQAATLLLAGILGFLTWSQSRQYADAETLYRTTISSNPSCWMAYLNLGELKLHGSDTTEEAVVYINEALRLKPDSAGAHNDLGVALWTLGHIEEAVTQYNEALRLWPNFAEAQFNLGVAFEGLGRFEEAEKQYREALRIKPNFPKAQKNLGDVLQNMGHVEEAVAHINEALRWRPDYAEAHNSLGNALKKMGRFQESVTQYDMALRLKPDYADAHTNMGLALQGMGRLDDAVVQHTEALRLEPDLGAAHYNLANALAVLGRLQDAVAQYRDALRCDSRYAEAHNQLGVALEALGQVDEATKEYKESLRLKPQSADAHNNLGHALLGTGHLDQAIAHFEEALQLKPDYAPAHFNLGNILQAAGHFKEAVAQYKEALAHDPDSAETHNNLAIALERLGFPEEAETHLKEALRLKPDYAEARANLARIQTPHKTRK